MKKTPLILIIVLLGLLLPQTAKSQLQLSQKLDYSNPPLKYYRITDNVRYTEIDFSKQKITTEEDGKYSVKLPFVVSKTAPAGELFWLLLYAPNDSKFSSWGIYTASNKFICKSFHTYRTSDAAYLIQTQDNLSQQVIAGNYYLKLTFSAKPMTKDIKISVAYSTQAVLNEFAAILKENQIPATPPKPAETTVTKTTNGEVIIPNVTNQPATSSNTQREKSTTKLQNELVGTTWKDGDLILKFSRSGDNWATLSCERWGFGTMSAKYTFNGTEGKLYLVGGDEPILRITKSGTGLKWKCTDTPDCWGFSVTNGSGKKVKHYNGIFYKR